ncbi:adenosine deaminase [Longilinea arvoryzae]|uniref:adenosine deaminase n=1 Tax=Longilinea arvoryzae TaxID=360412 RepID=A0A0S7BEL1_9CHLR|nr:adenosine deaminase [Longilinea arvoryzae]GAP13897.1 adenosine deaminase [Longilinea arvoryzae]
MGWYERPSTRDFYDQLPKVELHRHLEGALRVDTLVEIARKQNLALPSTGRELQALVQVQTAEALNSTVFLSKFQTLRQFFCSPEIITRVTREAIADARADGVRYLELRFTPLALSRIRGFSLAEVMDWVCDSAAQAGREYDLPTNLIVSVNRHESVEIAEQVIDLALQRRERGIVGLDLAGNEADFDALPFLEVFTEARASGLHITVHAGEWNGPENVRQAIEIFHADRIGHGVRVVEDPDVVACARESQTAFEVCLTSNYQTGVVRSLQEHPFLQMLAEGLNVTVNTDDPSISQIALSDEYRAVVEKFGLDRWKLQELILSGARASFLASTEKQRLVHRLEAEFETVIHPE